MKHSSIKFFLKGTQKLKPVYPIFARVIYDRKKVEFSINYSVELEKWDETLQQVKRDFIINQSILDLRTKMNEFQHEMYKKNRPYTVKDIKAHLLGEKTSDLFLLDYYREYIERKRKSQEVTQTTLQKYKQTLTRLIEFLNNKGLEKLGIEQFEKNTLAKFDDFLKSTPIDKYGRLLTLVSVNKHHSRLKAVFNDAIKRDIIVRNPYRDFKLRYPYKQREYLTVDELSAIENFDFSAQTTLDKVRDIFVFSCYTGLRFTDAMNLTMDDIFMENNQYYLRIDQHKTGVRREIPFLPKAKEITDKYNDYIGRKIENKVLPTISNQKCNLYLKMAVDIAGIKKEVTHHVARHTCATTILLGKGVSLDDVAYFLGQEKTETAKIYAKMSKQRLEGVRKLIE